LPWLTKGLQGNKKLGSKQSTHSSPASEQELPLLRPGTTTREKCGENHPW